MSEVTLDVVQGVGDIFWIYQKMHPYYDTINFNILCIDKGEIQTRAEKFIKLLPGVKDINYKVVTSAHYNDVAWQRHDIRKIFNDPMGSLPYAVNRPLEIGYRLEEVDAGSKVEWNVPFNIPVDKLSNKNYIVLYISGSKNNLSWDLNKWVQLIVYIYRTYKLHTMPLVLFGATYDMGVLNQLVPTLKANAIQVSSVYNSAPIDAIRTIRDCKLFIGYQSGMNIIADNYDVPQIMMYFPELKPMLNTWCKPGHAEKKLFNGFTFSQGVDEVAIQSGAMLNAVARGVKLI